MYYLCTGKQQIYKQDVDSSDYYLLYNEFLCRTIMANRYVF